MISFTYCTLPSVSNEQLQNRESKIRKNSRKTSDDWLEARENQQSKLFVLIDMLLRIKIDIYEKSGISKYIFDCLFCKNN